ncbi:MAG: hypothetical protein ABSG83_05815 [Roseiarcus sp.]|jgi:DNA polymerase/3'-5' exonuclease PolX
MFNSVQHHKRYLFIIGKRGCAMAREQNAVGLINRLFEEATRMADNDPLAIAREVEARIAALGSAERVAISGAVGRLLAFSAPEPRGRPLH